MDVPQPLRSGYRPSLQILSQHYSVNPTLKYPLHHDTAPSYTNPSHQNVFDRLYQHHSIRKSNRESLQVSKPQIIPPRRSVRPLSPKIEDQLVKRDKEAKEELTMLRAKYMAQTLQEVRPVPEINQMSKKIMERLDRVRFGVKSELPKVQVAPLQVAIKEERREEEYNEQEAEPAEDEGQFHMPKLSIPQLQTQPSPSRLSKSETNMLKAMVLHGKYSVAPSNVRTQLGIPSPKGIVTERTMRDGDSEVVKRVTLQSLREEVMSRFRGLEPELPPDYFSMPFDTRNRMFLETRTVKIQQEKERTRAKELEECTFQPIFYTRIPHKSLNRSTSELLLLSRERSPRSLSQASNSRSSSATRSQSYYQQYQKRLTESLRARSESMPKFNPRRSLPRTPRVS